MVEGAPVAPKPASKPLHPKWRKRFLKLAAEVASWSKDPSTRVGCVLVDSNLRVIGLGYNGFPRGVADTRERLDVRSTKIQITQHAEVNALHGSIVRPEGAIAFVTHPPCAQCAGALIQSGVRAVVCREPGPGLAERFRESFELSTQMFEEAGVSYWIMPEAGIGEPAPPPRCG